MGELLAEIFGADRKQWHGFLSGPTFAIEVARQLPAAVTVAAYDDSGGQGDSSDSQHAQFSSVYFAGRGRRANWRGGQKRYRHRCRYQRWLGLRAQRARGVDHARSGGDDSIGGALGRGCNDPCRSAGLRRFGAHQHRRFKPQSYRRFTDCAGQDVGGNYRRHPNRSRRRAQYPFTACLSAPARRSTCQSSSRCIKFFMAAKNPLTLWRISCSAL